MMKTKIELKLVHRAVKKQEDGSTGQDRTADLSVMNATL